MRLHLIGTGTPTPTPERFGTAYVVETGGDGLLFDCGPATTHKLVKAGLHPTRIHHLFLSHHHFDHNCDLPCFALCRWDQCRGDEPPLRIYGPPPTARIVTMLLGADGAFALDWKARAGAPISQSVHARRGGALPRPEPRIEAHDVEEGLVAEGGNWRVTAAKAEHVEPWLTTLAFRVDTEAHSVVFAGDTRPCATVTTLARGAETLVVHCWGLQTDMAGSGEDSGMTSARAAGAMAHDCNARRLILSHLSADLACADARDEARHEVAQSFHGEVVFGQELTALEL